MKKIRLFVVSLRPGCLWNFLESIMTRLRSSGETRIVVRLGPGGFEASLKPPRRNGELQVYWQEEADCWRPEPTSHRLLRTAGERLVELELPPEFTLTQCVKLPSATLANLSDAIAFGLPSWSPFEASEVYVKGSLHEVRAGQAKVRLYYAPKKKVDPLLVRLAAVGLPADRIVLEPVSSQSVELSTPKSAYLRRARRVDAVLVVMAIFLALLIGSLRVMILSHRLEEVEAILRSELAHSRQTEALQSAFASFAARRATVSEKRTREIRVYEFLSILAQYLPDQTFIQTLEFGAGRGRIELSGFAPEAALEALRLIPIFQNLEVEPMARSNSVTVKFEITKNGA